LLSVVAPVLDREVETATTHLHAWVAGDLDARAYARVWRSADQRRWLALFAGTKVPTAPVEGNGSGSPLPSELQPGCSSIAPYLGAAYGGRVGILSGQVSADVYVPFSVRSAPHPGDSLRASAWLQAALTRKIASRGGISARVDGTGELSPNLPDPNSGGAIVYATTDILVTPVEDLVLSVGASFPAVQAWLGIHRETAIGSVHVAYDF
jgi:hypothetical protein